MLVQDIETSNIYNNDMDTRRSPSIPTANIITSTGSSDYTPSSNTIQDGRHPSLNDDEEWTQFQSQFESLLRESETVMQDTPMAIIIKAKEDLLINMIASLHDVATPTDNDERGGGNIRQELPMSQINKTMNQERGMVSVRGVASVGGAVSIGGMVMGITIGECEIHNYIDRSLLQSVH